MPRRPPVPAPEDIVLGQPLSPYPDPVVRLTPADQQYHATIWGRTGSGKSRFLQALFLQHLSRGQAVCLIEPHHDLSHDTLAYLVEKGFFRQPGAFDRLVYLDWGNGSFVPYNCLAGSAAPQTRALHAMEAMLRVWPELRRAPTFQTLFLSAMVVLIANQLPITALHREAASHCGVLPVLGRGRGRAPPAHPEGPPALPLAHSSNHPSPQIGPIAGRSKDSKHKLVTSCL